MSNEMKSELGAHSDGQAVGSSFVPFLSLEVRNLVFTNNVQTTHELVGRNRFALLKNK